MPNLNRMQQRGSRNFVSSQRKHSYDTKDTSFDFATQIAVPAVRKIAEDSVRLRARQLIERQLASEMLIIKPSEDDVQMAWERFTTRHLQKHKGIAIWIWDSESKPTKSIDAKPALDFKPPSPPTVQLNKNNDAKDIHFKPSPELITAWLDGLNAVRAEVGHDALAPVSLKTQDLYATELTRLLRKVISNFAKRKSYHNEAYRITFNRKFLPTIEGLIEDHLMLPPRNAVVFLDIFNTELYNQSSLNPAFSGRWGDLIIDDADELVLKLQKRRSRKLSSVLRGK